MVSGNAFKKDWSSWDGDRGVCVLLVLALSSGMDNFVFSWSVTSSHLTARWLSPQNAVFIAEFPFVRMLNSDVIPSFFQNYIAEIKYNIW